MESYTLVYICIRYRLIRVFTYVKYTLFRFVNMKNEMLRNLFKEESYYSIKFSEIAGRYVTNSSLEIVRKRFKNNFKIHESGKSVQGKSIYSFKIGSGKIKILAWSQMHGNESTTTKAVFDLLNSFKLNSEDEVISNILENCSLCIIPILNPDGAEAYTRVNAKLIDLNRDLQDLSQPESRLLKDIYNEFKPDFCLNLHDQRTIFSAGNNSRPATLSFLTPSKDEERTIDKYRKRSMSLIAGMTADLNEYLPGAIGRYDDGFNINCAGDTFQNLSTPTVLFEAGHFPDDYEREETRKHIYRAIISCLHQISKGKLEYSDYEEYFQIPENEKLFSDIIIRRALINGEVKDISIQFKEVLKNNKINFLPIISKVATQISNYGHKEIDAEKNETKLLDNSEIIENVIVNKIVINNEELEVK
ncbi:M14 family zinc carboxypeptidase [Christiangramia forsetii]|uniref:Peptidase, family M14 n=2 Tax=Christiangramia forsetii TaxID=411153 RepID=A0M1G3_CHRFK|nr:M14 family zinc carboxypeptidase [Christiangramia forsetii]CAL66458.1 peptidase, family M14 [Christiangramia forsetii KT0803]